MGVPAYTQAAERDHRSQAGPVAALGLARRIAASIVEGGAAGLAGYAAFVLGAVRHRERNAAAPDAGDREPGEGRDRIQEPRLPGAKRHA